MTTYSAIISDTADYICTSIHITFGKRQDGETTEKNDTVNLYGALHPNITYFRDGTETH